MNSKKSVHGEIAQMHIAFERQKRRNEREKPNTWRKKREMISVEAVALSVRAYTHTNRTDLLLL